MKFGLGGHCISLYVDKELAPFWVRRKISSRLSTHTKSVALLRERPSQLPKNERDAKWRGRTDGMKIKLSKGVLLAAPGRDIHPDNFDMGARASRDRGSW